MRKRLLTTFLTLALLFMATPNLHAATGNYIDCIHGCPDLISCNNCCNETFRSSLGACDGKRDQCEALCPPGDMYCLDACVMTRNDCLMQDMRDFDCPHWGKNGRNLGIGSGAGVSVFSSTTPSASVRRS